MVIQNKFYSGVRKKKKFDPYALEIYWATDAHMLAVSDGDASNPAGTLGNRLFYTAGQKMQRFVDTVNAEAPDLVFFSGDMLEYWGSAGTPELFATKWNQIKTRKELTVGNHDMAAGGAAVANTTMATLFGYGNKPIIAGSKYNQSFYLDNGFNKVKVISFDTNLDANGNHVVITAQMLKQPVRDWIQSELLNCESESVILYSHASPADDSGHFNAEDALAFKTMIDSVASQKPGLKMYSLAGHNHRQGLREYTTMGNNIKCYSISPVVDFLTGKYGVVRFSQKTGLQIVEKDLGYPYP